MKNKDEIYRQVEQAFKSVGDVEDPLPSFIEEVRKLIAPKVSDQFFDRQDFDHDISYLYNTYKEYDFKHHQLVLLVSNYIKKGMKIDCQSRQGPDGKETYMRLIRSSN